MGDLARGGLAKCQIFGRSGMIEAGFPRAAIKTTGCNSLLRMRWLEQITFRWYHLNV
jgi:hypothetical protein